LPKLLGRPLAQPRSDLSFQQHLCHPSLRHTKSRLTDSSL
jgi:hypothetical protein